MKVAFYKGKGTFFNWVIRKKEKGPYSHVELVFNNGMWASSVIEEGGIVARKRNVNLDEWDFIEIPDSMEVYAAAWFVMHQGKGYDLLGQLSFFFKEIQPSKRRFWCSEAVAAALGLPSPEGYGVNPLYQKLHEMYVANAVAA